MPDLVLGPIVRSVGTDDAAVWVETDAACAVEILGHREHTFHVAGHHYALVDVQGLEAGAEHPYEVALDGRRVWPPPDSGLPPSVLRTWEPGRTFRLVAGSCQQAGPHGQREDALGNARSSGPDALDAYARRLLAGDVAWPDALLLLGDQVYADRIHPDTVDVLDRRRGRPPRPGWPPVTSFEEYTWLYQHTWSPPLLRWLLSNVPTLMIFDDHDVIDDWNISEQWRRQMQEAPWWSGRIHGGLMSYWLYQHLGNSAFHERQDDELLQELRAAEDGGSVLRAFAQRADTGTPGNLGHRWSYRRDFGPCRLVVVDSRNGRVLETGKRSMLDEAEWSWLDDNLHGGVDHLLVGSSLPWLLPQSIHDLEAWGEQLAEGRWGARASRLGEWLRQEVDLEHWAAFGGSFDRLTDLVAEVASGRRGGAPSTVLVLSGDVHFGYVAEAQLEGMRSRVRQVVTSPIRRVVPNDERRAQRAIIRPPLSWLTRALARTMPRALPQFGWDITDGPCFDNNIATLVFEGRSVRLHLDAAVVDRRGLGRLERVVDREL